MLRPLITVVSPFFNEGEGAQHFCRKILQVFDTLNGYSWQLICVDDGSRDQTLGELNAAAVVDSRIKVLGLSRNFGHQLALLAGLEAVDPAASAVIMMDSDLQHPPELISTLLAQWENGFEVVSTIRRVQKGSSLLKRLTSFGYYRALRLIADIEVTPGAADFCLLDREALSAVLQFRERSPYLRGIISWIGFNRSFVHFDAPARVMGTSKYSIAKMFRLGADGVFSFSVSPMRASLKMGVAVTIVAILYLVYAMAVFATNGAVKGWTSLLAVVVFFGGLNLVSLGLIGEYLGRTFQEVKGRPRYILRNQRAVDAAQMRDDEMGPAKQGDQWARQPRAVLAHQEKRPNLDASFDVPVNNSVGQMRDTR